MLFDLGNSFTLPLTGLASDHKPLDMLWVTPGAFMMGSPENELGRDNYYDQTPFRVVHQNGYWLGKYPVTQAQWQTVMNNNPSHNPSCMDCPVENVNWHLAIAFCEILNSQFQNSLQKGYFFSLPTEAQWEYACRADTHSTFYTGNDEEAVKKAAWYIANSANHSHRVGEKQANPWGFYDMLGNVSEWCYDEVDNYPSISIQKSVASSQYKMPEVECIKNMIRTSVKLY